MASPAASLGAGPRPTLSSFPSLDPLAPIGLALGGLSLGFLGNHDVDRLYLWYFLGTQQQSHARDRREARHQPNRNEESRAGGEEAALLDAALHEMGLMILGFGARVTRVIPKSEPMMSFS